MQIRVGYELIYECPQPTPMILTLSIHYTRASDILIPDFMTTDPRVPPGSIPQSRVSGNVGTDCFRRSSSADSRWSNCSLTFGAGLKIWLGSCTIG